MATLTPDYDHQTRKLCNWTFVSERLQRRTFTHNDPIKNYAHSHTRTLAHMTLTIKKTLCSAITPKSCQTPRTSTLTFRVYGHLDRITRIKCVQYIHTTHGDLRICKTANGGELCELLAIRVGTNWCQHWCGQLLLYSLDGRRHRRPTDGLQLSAVEVCVCVCIFTCTGDVLITMHTNAHTHSYTLTQQRVVRQFWTSSYVWYYFVEPALRIVRVDICDGRHMPANQKRVQRVLPA